MVDTPVEVCDSVKVTVECEEVIEVGVWHCGVLFGIKCINNTLK